MQRVVTVATSTALVSAMLWAARLELDACGSTLDGTLNTWENVFFFLHDSDFGAEGFEVGGRVLAATGPHGLTAS